MNKYNKLETPFTHWAHMKNHKLETPFTHWAHLKNSVAIQNWKEQVEYYNNGFNLE